MEEAAQKVEVKPPKITKSVRVHRFYLVASSNMSRNRTHIHPDPELVFATDSQRVYLFYLSLLNLKRGLHLSMNR
jgi:hypothetical protein